MAVNIQELENEVQTFRKNISNAEQIIKSISLAADRVNERTDEFKSIVENVNSIQQQQAILHKNQENAYQEFISKILGINSNIDILFNRHQENILKNQETINREFLLKSDELKTLINELFCIYKEQALQSQEKFKQELDMKSKALDLFVNNISERIQNELLENLRMLTDNQSRFNNEFLEKGNEINRIMSNLPHKMQDDFFRSQEKINQDFLLKYNEANAVINSAIKKVNNKINSLYAVIGIVGIVTLISIFLK